MKRLIPLLALLTVGCNWRGPTQNVNVGQTPPCTGVGCGTGGTPGFPGQVTNFRCVRVEDGNGEASKCTVQWDGDPAPRSMVAVRVSDNLSDSFVAVSPGATIDPGPGGTGGGTWTLSLETGEQTTVVLDT